MMHFSIVLDTRWTTSVYVVYLFVTVAAAAIAFESDPWTSGVKSGAIAIPLTQYAAGKNEKEKVPRGKVMQVSIAGNIIYVRYLSLELGQRSFLEFLCFK